MAIGAVRAAALQLSRFVEDVYDADRLPRDYYEVLGVGRTPTRPRSRRRSAGWPASCTRTRTSDDPQAEEQVQGGGRGLRGAVGRRPPAAVRRLRPRRAALRRLRAELRGLRLGLGPVLRLLRLRRVRRRVRHGARRGAAGDAGRRRGRRRGDRPRRSRARRRRSRSSYEVDARCEHCHGNGAEPGTPIVTCPRCHGSGQLQAVSRTRFGQLVRTAVCDVCGGDGRVPEQPCTVCGGAGQLRETRTRGRRRARGHRRRPADPPQRARPRRRARRPQRRPLRRRPRARRRPLRARPGGPAHRDRRRRRRTPRSAPPSQVPEPRRRRSRSRSPPAPSPARSLTLRGRGLPPLRPRPHRRPPRARQRRHPAPPQPRAARAAPAARRLAHGRQPHSGRRACSRSSSGRWRDDRAGSSGSGSGCGASRRRSRLPRCCRSCSTGRRRPSPAPGEIEYAVYAPRAELPSSTMCARSWATR